MIQSVTEEKVRGLIKLATIQGSNHRLFAATQDENCSIDDITSIIKHDQAIAVRLVSVANSSAFGYRGKIDSIEQAVLLLGMNLVRSIALGVAMFTLIPLPGQQLENLWGHSYAVALLSESIAQRRKGSPNGTAFLAGLLHDIGRIVIMTLNKEAYSEQILSTGSVVGSALLAAERNFFQCDHATAGGWFLDSLNFPQDITASCANHHSSQPEGLTCSEDIYVYLAEGLTGYSEQPTAMRGDGQWTDKHEAFFYTCGFNQDDLVTFTEFLTAHTEDIASFFHS